MEKLKPRTKVVYGTLGIIFALVFFFIGLQLGSYLGDRIADIRRVSYESSTSSITLLIFMIFLILIGFLIYKLTSRKSKNVIVLGKFFLWTLIIVDGLYILFLLFYTLS